MSTIEYAKLTRAQQTTYDFAVGVAKMDPDSDELRELLKLQAQPKTRIRREQHEQREAISREAHAVLLHLRKNETLKQKFCQYCKLPFATNYEYVGCCSDTCLAAKLAEIGIDWNPEKTAEERWNGPGQSGEIPAIITPVTLKFLKTWARKILSWDEEVQNLDNEDEDEPEETEEFVDDIALDFSDAEKPVPIPAPAIATGPVTIDDLLDDI